MAKLQTPLWDLNLEESVYEPSEDTFLLMDALEADLDVIKRSSISVALEIGSGSGVVICSIATHFPTICCLAVDINPNACSATQTTAQLNNVQVEVVRSDLVDFLMPKRVDLLLFNPPYVPSEAQDVIPLTNKAWAGSSKGRLTTDRLFPQLPQLMSERCLGYIVALEENDPREMISVISSYGFDCSTTLKRKIIGEKLSIIRFHKGISI